MRIPARGLRSCPDDSEPEEPDVDATHGEHRISIRSSHPRTHEEGKRPWLPRPKPRLQRARLPLNAATEKPPERQPAPEARS